MKIKTILISAVLVIGVGAAASYFVRRSYESSIKQVEVVPITSVNSSSYGSSDSGTISGTIISRDTQVVSLDTSHDLKAVYVQEGDRVRKGDKLLEYDMLGDELKEEMEELTKMGLELNLERMKRDLAILQSGRMPNSMADDYASDSDFSWNSGSDDEDEEDDSTDIQRTGRSQAGVQEQGSGAVGAADTLAGAYSLPKAVAGITRGGALSSSALTETGLNQTLGTAGFLGTPAETSDEQKLEEIGEDETEEDSTDSSLPELGKAALFEEDPADISGGEKKAPPAIPVDGNDTSIMNEIINDQEDNSGADTMDAIPAADEDGDGSGLTPDGDSGKTDGETPAIIAGLNDTGAAGGEEDKSDSDGNETSGTKTEAADEPALALSIGGNPRKARSLAAAPLAQNAGLVDENGAAIGEAVPSDVGEAVPADVSDINPDGDAAEQGSGDAIGAAAEDLIVSDEFPEAGSNYTEEGIPAAVESSPEAASPVGDEVSAGFAGSLIEEVGTVSDNTSVEGAPVETVAPAETVDPTGMGGGVVSDQGTGTNGAEVVPEGTQEAAPEGTQEVTPEVTQGTAPSAPEGTQEAAPAVVSQPEMTFMRDNPNGEFTEDDIFWTLSYVNSFLSKANDLSFSINFGWDGVGWDGIESLMDEIDYEMWDFRNSFADPVEVELVNLLGETVTVTRYVVKDSVRAQIGDATASVLQAAYDRLTIYHFYHTVMSLNPNRIPSSSMDPAWISQNEARIREVVNEYASLPDSMRIYNPATGKIEFSSEFAVLNDGLFSGEPINAFLTNIALTLNPPRVEEPEEEEPVASTEENMAPNQNYYDDDYDTGPEYTMQELLEAIREQERNIKETELQIREAELGIKEYKKILDGKIVYATMDGVVKNAGTVDSSYSNAFITITGKAGLYAKGSVNELALDTVKLGDTITGTSYSSGRSFTAEIVEISEYPDTSSNYYGFGEENTNSSYYPFIAYIQDAEGLEVNTYVELSLNNTTAQISSDGSMGGGLSLDEYYVRTDGNGRSYCYVRGKDGLLEKRYLEVGSNTWGVITIKSGLTQGDYIAFPYGDGVEEGAQTVVVSSLSAVNGDDY